MTNATEAGNAATTHAGDATSGGGCILTAMARLRTVLIVSTLLVACGLVACGGDEDDAPAFVGHWVQIEAGPPAGGPGGAGPGGGGRAPSFLRLTAAGGVEQFDGEAAYLGTWRLEGDTLHFTPMDEVSPPPKMGWSVQDDVLELTFEMPQGAQKIGLKRVDHPTGAKVTKPRYNRLVGTLHERLRVRIDEVMTKRGRGEVVTLGDIDPRGEGTVAASVRVPWTLGGEAVEPQSGRIEFTLVWLDGDWRLLRAQLHDRGTEPGKGIDMFEPGPQGMPKVNEGVPFAASAWRAWQDTMEAIGAP